MKMKYLEDSCLIVFKLSAIKFTLDWSVCTSANICHKNCDRHIFLFDSTKTDPNPTPPVNQNAPCESSPNLLVRPNITLTYCYTITHPNRPS